MQNKTNDANAAAEAYAKFTKLEGIFLPHVRHRRNQLDRSPSTRCAKFVHYTSAEAAIKIITKKHLWLRSTSCMADYREVQHGFEILWRSFSKQENKDAFTKAVDLFAPGAADAAINQFNDWWKSGTIQNRTYIASVSEHDSREDLHGRLSMWRAFGGNSARVGLILNVPEQSPGADAMRLNFCPVSYFKNEEAWLIPEVVNQMTKNTDYLKSIAAEEIKNWIFSMLLVNVAAVKHEGFREEREWRVIHSPDLYPNQHIKPSTEIIAGIPQIVYKLPLDKKIDPVIEDLDLANLFDRLIIGPSPYPHAMADAFIEALSNIGVTEAAKKIWVSGIPIRS